MKRISILNYGLSILLFAVVPQCSLLQQQQIIERTYIQGNGNFTTPDPSWDLSFYNRGYKAGSVDGEQRGYDLGYLDGMRDGEAIGIEKGKEMERYRILAIQDSLTDEELLLITQQLYEYKDTIDKYRQLFETGFQAGLAEGQALGYHAAFREGFNAAFDTLYPLNLRKGQALQYGVYDPSQMNLSIAYERIARFMAEKHSQNSYLQAADFAELLEEVHGDFIRLVIQMLELDGQEALDMFTRYAEIHPDLSSQYYDVYYTNMRLKNRDLDKNFYNYSYYHSNIEFTKVIKTGLCSLMDVLVTYAKNNSQCATVMGFEVMGHLCEVLHREPLIEFEDALLKSALIFDYDLNKDQLNAALKDLMATQIVEVRGHIADSDYLSYSVSGFDVQVATDLIQVMAVGFDVDKMSVTVDHNAEAFIVSISDQPVDKGIIYELNYSRKVDAETIAPPSPVSSYYSVLLNENDLAAPGPFSRIDSGQPLGPFRPEQIKKYEPLLKKLMEPAVGLTTSCYDVFLEFSGTVTPLLITSCTHQ